MGDVTARDQPRGPATPTRLSDWGTAYGAQRKLISEIGYFRSCPIPLKKSSFEVIAAVRIGGATTPVSAASPQVAAIGAGAGISLASLRRFWAVAARWNSSRAPFGPRNRSRELEDAFEVGEQHLDLLSFAP